MFPPIPSWEGIHPLLIHFPIALLIVATLFLFLALVFRSSERSFGISALILMLCGTIGLYVAVASGEAGAGIALRTPEIDAAIEEHEEGAELARVIFTVLTLVFAALMLLPLLRKRELPRRVALMAQGLFLVVYAACLLVLANVAHDGGQLVHRYGVHALLPAEPADAVLAAEQSDD